MRGDERVARWWSAATRAVVALAVISGAAIAGPAAAPLRPGELMFQFRDDVVVSSAAQAGWGSGPYQLEAVPDDRSDQIVASRGVDLRRLPAALAQRRGRALQLYAWDGTACAATVTGFRLVGVARLAPTQMVAWTALRDPARGDPATGGDGWQDQPAMAESAWNQGAHYLVATVDRHDTCAADAWARDAALPPPPIANAQTPEVDVRTLAVEAFRALPEWQRLQQAYARSPEYRRDQFSQPHGGPSWDDRGDAQPHVQRFHLATGGAIEHELISVIAVHDDPDPARDRRLWAVFEYAGPSAQPSMRLRALATGRAVPAGLELQAIVDLRRNGHPALLYGARAGLGVALEAGAALVDQPAARAPR